MPSGGPHEIKNVMGGLFITVVLNPPQKEHVQCHKCEPREAALLGRIIKSFGGKWDSFAVTRRSGTGQVKGDKTACQTERPVQAKA